MPRLSAILALATVLAIVNAAKPITLTTPDIKLEYAWTTTAIIDLDTAITVPVEGGNKTIYNVVEGSSFAGPKLNGSFTGAAEVSQLVTGLGDSYQVIDVTVWGHTEQGVPFYATESGRGNGQQNQLRRIKIDIGPGHADLREGLFVGDLLAPPSNKLSVVTYEVVDSSITYP